MGASQPTSYDVFLSHGTPDKPWVRTLQRLLTQAGVVAYLDEVAIDAGDNFVCNLSDGVGQTSTFVIIVSHGTMNRPWVEHEWTSFLATHGPRSRIIPVLLDEVALPAFLRPYQAIHAIDRDAEAVTARIVRAVGRGNTAGAVEWCTGQALVFTIASVEGSDDLAVTPADGVTRIVAAPWRRGNAFGLALMDFERLAREPARGDALRRLVSAAQVLGAALSDLLFSDDSLLVAFGRATAPGPRAVLTLRSDEDVLLSLPWELLFHDQRFLVRDGFLDVVRSTTGAVQFETQLTPPSKPFTLVTNVSAPEGSGLNYEAESFRITHALTDHCTETPTELGTLVDLIETASRERPRGVHFSGHGVPGALVFEDDEGFDDRVAINRLVTELRRNGDGSLPPFFFLASCHSNTPAQPEEGQGGSASSAAQLHREGVTEVVGYYGPIADELSTRAEEALYAAISAGEPTRLAVSRARGALLRSFEGDATRLATFEPALARSPDAVATSTHPFAWAQLVFYHRGPEYPLGTPASEEKLRRREATLKRTYRNLTDRTFLATGFVGRRRELHQLRRRRRRGDRVFVLQGLGGLGKTTLAGQLLPTLADEESIIGIWCRRTEGDHDSAEALVGQLLVYARSRFGAQFEQVVSYVDREASESAVQRFDVFLRFLLDQQKGAPLVVYLDNLESLLSGPTNVSLETAPDPDAFGSWLSDELRGIWRVLAELSGAAENLLVVATCRYRNDDLSAYLLPVPPLSDADVFRLMAWFPALRRLSTRSRLRLASRIAGHPRAVEFLDDLVAATLRSWEEANGDWKSVSSSDEEALAREWKQFVLPILPEVEERIWSDLFLAALWDRVLDERARRMLFRMTLLRTPWHDDLTPQLGEPNEDCDVARLTARSLAGTSLLERTDLTVATHEGRLRRPHFTVHASTAAFVRNRFTDADDVAVASHRRIGTHFEAQARLSTDPAVAFEGGHHFFEAEEYDRAFTLLGPALANLQGCGRMRESLQILLPFLSDDVKSRMNKKLVAGSLGAAGIAFLALGDAVGAIERYERALIIVRETGDRRGEAGALGNLGNAYFALGEMRRAIHHYRQARDIAREIGDRESECGALGNLGNGYFALGATQRAIAYHEKAVAIARETGDRQRECAALSSLGVAYRRLGDIGRAIELFEQHLVVSRAIGDRHAEGVGLTNLGNVYAGLGEMGRAIEHYDAALVTFREIGDRRDEGLVLCNLGNAYRTVGDAPRAIEILEHALAIACETRNRRGEGTALANLGTSYFALGETRLAVEKFEAALAIAREIGDRSTEGILVGNLGNVSGAMGDLRSSIEHLEQALIAARETFDRSSEGHVLANLGVAHNLLGDAPRAIECFQQSLAIGREISEPEIILPCEKALALLLPAIRFDSE